MDPALDRRAFVRAARTGAALALLLEVVMLSAGHLSLWHQMGLLGSFYDIQARALLHGHLAVPTGSISIEGFVVGGRTYMYFGLVPALARLPILALTHALDGRMTQLSMLAAYVVLLGAGERVAWRVRMLAAPCRLVSGAERLAVGVLLFTLGAGAVPLFLASWPVVYHEAELWGAALSLAAFASLLALTASPGETLRIRSVALAGGLALLAASTRVSVGLGPIIALALLGGGALLRRSWRDAALLLAAAAIALAPAVAVNEARFQSAFGVPLGAQIDTRIDPLQRAFVARYHGAATGLQFVPTTLLATLRPDALGEVRAFPFVGLPAAPPDVIGGARFNALLPSLSVFTAMPLLALLALGGLWAVARVSRLRRLAPVLVAAAAGYLPALSFGSTATRYLTDLLPFLFLGASVGLAWLASKDFAAMRRRLLLAGMILLALTGAAINGAVGIIQQQLLAPTTSASTRAAFVGFQDSVDELLGRQTGGVQTGGALPGGLGRAGDLFVLGRCDGLYARVLGGTWLPVERSTRSGLHELAVRFTHSGSPSPLLRLRSVHHRLTLFASPAGPRHVAFSLRLDGKLGGAGAAVPVSTAASTRLTVSFDQLGATWFLSARIGSRAGLDLPVPYDREARAILGPGVRAVPEPTPVCDELARRARLF